MAVHSDTEFLVQGLQTAIEIWRKYEGKGLLGRYSPGPEVLEPLERAIEKCASYKAVEGEALFSGYSGFILRAPSLAAPLLYRADRPDRGETAIHEAAEWLIRLFTTQRSTGIFTAAIWGLRIDRPLEIDPNTTLIPFDQLPDTPMKRRVLERAQEVWDESVWLTERFYDVPAAAMRRSLADFPYIGSPDIPFERLSGVQVEAREQLTFLQVTATGAPLVAGSWFEWEDELLDLNAYENFVVWHLPEVEPRVAAHIAVKADDIGQHVRAFRSLPDDLRRKLLRSMDRFVLSQCRNQIADQILDLVIAFETALSGKGDYGPVNWKVGVRSAQLIGGKLEMRQEIRKDLRVLYNLRSATAHGGSINPSDIEEHGAMLEKCWFIYRDLVGGFLSLQRPPDWTALELEPRVRG